MTSLRSRYQAISFRGRLLLLLLAVSLLQATAAAYTFVQLQSKPAEQRVQAQLNAALRGFAPVIDAELTDASKRLTELIDDPSFNAAVDAEDWTAVQAAIDTQRTAAEAAAAEDAAALEQDDAAATGDQPAERDTQAATVHGAYVTDPADTVLAGTRPEGAIIEQGGYTTSRVLRGAKLVATIHVPVVVDHTFLADRIAEYVPKNVDVFVADAAHLSSSAEDATDAIDRPAGLREGLHEVTIDGVEQLALTQPLLDGSVLVGATMPVSRAHAQEQEGRSSLWGFIVLMTVLMIGVSLILTRAVADALRRFADIARDLAGGHLDRRLPVTGEDEIAVLASSFNDMAEHLEDRIARLTQARVSMRRQVELFGEALANATDIEEMLQAVCSLAMESTPATHARFWTLNDDGRFEHAACIGLRPGDDEPCGLEKAVPLRNASVRGEGSPHWLVVPARMRSGQIVGLLTLVSVTADFAEDDVRIAERIAVQAAVAIDNARMHERLRLQATRDGLTGLPNHRSLQDELARRVAEAYDADMPLGVCLFDIDNFKRINDTYGHPVGDEAIKAIAGTLEHGMGGMGMVARYGGEEFVVIIPGCDLDAAARIADRLREDITRIELPLEDGTVLTLTASGGVANLDTQHRGTRVGNAELLHQADVGLYNAKRTGKNRIVTAGPDSTVIEMTDSELANLAARERGVTVAEAGSGPVRREPSDPFDLAA